MKVKSKAIVRLSDGRILDFMRVDKESNEDARDRNYAIMWVYPDEDTKHYHDTHSMSMDSFQNMGVRYRERSIIPPVYLELYRTRQALAANQRFLSKPILRDIKHQLEDLLHYYNDELSDTEKDEQESISSAMSVKINIGLIQLQLYDT